MCRRVQNFAGTWLHACGCHVEGTIIASGNKALTVPSVWRFARFGAGDGPRDLERAWNAQSASLETASPPFRVPRARQVGGAIESLMNETWPSVKRVLAPELCRLPADHAALAVLLSVRDWTGPSPTSPPLLRRIRLANLDAAGIGNSDRHISNSRSSYR